MNRAPPPPTPTPYLALSLIHSCRERSFPRLLRRLFLFPKLPFGHLAWGILLSRALYPSLHIGGGKEAKDRPAGTGRRWRGHGVSNDFLFSLDPLISFHTSAHRIFCWAFH